MTCKLTVLMAVRNGGSYLRTAIDSILEQTYPAFHFLIVDDLSTDDTRETIASYTDSRMELHCLEKNLGQPGALNVGLRLATTPWIARMDADDYSAPTRLEEQMMVIDGNPSLSCVGTFVWIFHDDPHVWDGEITTPLLHEEMERVVVGSPIVHGSIIVNREALLDVGAYNERYRILADVDMYDRLLPKYRAATIPRTLLGVRRHPGQNSNSKSACDESIEISYRRLAGNNYTTAQASAARATLCRNRLLRARIMASEGKWVEACADTIRAVRETPKAFPFQSFVVFFVYNLGERNRSRLKSLLRRVTAMLKSTQPSP